MLENQNRVWLNGGERLSALAALHWSVTAYDNGSGSATLTIRDCSRQVDLDFDWATSDEETEHDYNIGLDERLEKLETFLTEVHKMRAAMLRAKRERRAAAKKAKKAKKAAT